MKIILRVILLGYYGMFTAFFLFSGLITLYGYINSMVENLTLWTPIWILMQFFLFLLVFKSIKDEKINCYLFATLTSISVLTVTTLHRFFFISNQHLNSIDINNAILFLSPILITLPLHITAKTSQHRS